MYMYVCEQLQIFYSSYDVALLGFVFTNSSNQRTATGSIF